MNATIAFPALLIVLELGAAAVYGARGNWTLVAYWLACAAQAVCAAVLGAKTTT